MLLGSLITYKIYICCVNIEEAFFSNLNRSLLTFALVVITEPHHILKVPCTGPKSEHFVALSVSHSSCYYFNDVTLACEDTNLVKLDNW